ncbi:prepilin peptidase [Nocardioides massiliensis]|uniref:Leader peptidase (Prepilin peptidase)/N-methyltransferase n=1 Tax=Nocardioides massiliensis TaxID=1325935 RepID=A0ABT9NQX6_9ACTN|nr:A24 family peptidase [Nocardioides massiliensis]MDP9822836.1 leader peptidase (prepilin peptidase)/N-methyltransferase [Nocardioides massiliensis]
MTTDPLAYAVLVPLCALLGLLVPGIVRRVPEPPAPEPDEIRADEPPKELYADVAARRWVRPGAVIFGALTGAAYAAGVGLDWELVFLLPIVPVGLALGAIDWRTKLLPYVLVAPLYPLTALLVVVVAAIEWDADILLRALVGWLATFAVYFALNWVAPGGFGYGDVRLSGVLGMAGGAVSWTALVAAATGGFFAMALLSIPLLLFGVIDRKDHVPFGPFMLVGAAAGIALAPVLAAGTAY